MIAHVSDGIAQVRRLWITFAVVLLAGGAALAMVIVGASAVGLDTSDLLRDPLAVLEANPLTGFLSNLGIVLWSASAGACFLAALVLRSDESRFFLWSGVLTTVLAVDDLYQLHEAVIPYVLGIDQRLVVLGYVALVALYVWRFRKILLETEYTLLVAAGIGFGVSIGTDLLPVEIWRSSLGPLVRLAEDGGKFFGILFWLAYFLRSGAACLAPTTVDPVPKDIARARTTGAS